MKFLRKGLAFKIKPNRKSVYASGRFYVPDLKNRFSFHKEINREVFEGGGTNQKTSISGFRYQLTFGPVAGFQNKIDRFRTEPGHLYFGSARIPMNFSNSY